MFLTGIIRLAVHFSDSWRFVLLSHSHKHTPSCTQRLLYLCTLPSISVCSNQLNCYHWLICMHTHTQTQKCQRITRFKELLNFPF